MATAEARQPIIPSVRANYRQVFKDMEAGQYQSAKEMVTRGNDPTLNMVLRSYLMAQPGNDYSFDDLAGFVSDHPDWPGLNGIIMIAEQKIPSSATPQQLVNWFEAHPPLTGSGFYRYMDALNALGRSQQAKSFVRDRWINKDFTSEELLAYHNRFSNFLTAQDHIARLDRLLWDNNANGAKAMYAYVRDGHKALAEARLALANQSGTAETLLDKVPENLRHNPGLLFERLRWRRKNNLDDGAIEVLMNAPSDLGNAEAWWNERHILIRRILENHNFRLAYKLAADHGLNANDGFEYLQAEFLSGWLALRFLKRADLAQTHFKKLYETASTPMSQARGAYWLGRTYEVLGDKISAEQAYETAGALNTTFYGQLALTRIYANPLIKANTEPAIPPSIRSRFFARDSVMAVERLLRIGQADKARLFFRALTSYTTQRVDFALLMELAYQLQRPDWAINAAKAAAQKNILIEAGSYPVLSSNVPTPPDLAFTHALIRQESHFNAEAGSPAGARGLMQLMPRTAKDVAKKLDIRYQESRLTEVDYNLRLGTAFIQEQLEKFDGSYILALAGYNAGSSRVREWIGLYGDPRSANVDPIDWIEMIPIYETRNYIQRIFENLQFYRARLNGGQAQLQILRDLKR